MSFGAGVALDKGRTARSRYCSAPVRAFIRSCSPEAAVCERQHAALGVLVAELRNDSRGEVDRKSFVELEGVKQTHEQAHGR
jgi:hypothetical protein